MNIKNRDEIVDKVTEMLMEFESCCNEYQTDIYLYYDEKAQTATVDTFVNPGGTSYKNDGHYLLYTDKGAVDHKFEEWFNYVTTPDEYAELFGMKTDELAASVKADCDIDDTEDVTAADILYYMKHCQREKLDEVHMKSIKQNRDYFEEEANFIMERFEAEHADEFENDEDEEMEM